jgi:hypothetical protein
MIADVKEIPFRQRTEWAPWPAVTENPVVRGGCDKGRKAETGVKNKWL